MENNRSAEPVYDLITCQRSKVQGEGKYARRFQLKQQPVHRMEAGRMEGGWGTCGMKLSAGCCCASVLPAGSAGCDLCGYVKRSIAQQPSSLLYATYSNMSWGVCGPADGHKPSQQEYGTGVPARSVQMKHGRYQGFSSAAFPSINSN